MEKKRLRSFYRLFAPTSNFMIMMDVVSAAQGNFIDEEDTFIWNRLIQEVHECIDSVRSFDIELLMDEIESFLCVNERLSKAYILDVVRKITEISHYMYGLPSTQGLSERDNSSRRNVVVNCENHTTENIDALFVEYLYEIDRLFHTFKFRFERKVIDCSYNYKEIIQSLRNREQIYFTSKGIVSKRSKDNGKESKSLIANYITSDDKDIAITAITNTVKNQKGKSLAMIIFAAKKLGLIKKNIPFAALQKIGAVGHKSGYDNYKDDEYTDDEIAPFFQQLKSYM